MQYSQTSGFEAKQTYNAQKPEYQNVFNSEKRPCRYGSKCYRKNPGHFQYYSHPQEQNRSFESLEEGLEKQLELVEKQFIA
ncbi:hypothetical protein I4U23_003997 [Adineta vaga]|nr:hypothetical protein I4U23_003997 [Adineta vaga]